MHTSPNAQPPPNNCWQQILALDARYNAYRTTNYPGFRTLYIRRRSQLLRENAKLHPDPAIRRHYMSVRSQLLCERYGVSAEGSISARSRSLSVRSGSVLTVEDPDVCVPHHSNNDEHHKAPTASPSSSVVPTCVADASRALVGDTSIAENYSFAGVHHVFDVNKGPVTRIRFANDERDRLAIAGSDGQLSICHVHAMANQSSVLTMLHGHTQAVTDVCWSISNDLLVSCSLDGSVRMWNAQSGECIRVIDDTQPIRCCLFQPLNNNLVVTGNQRGLVQVVNISTGKYIKSGQCRTLGACMCMCSEHSGRVLWVGDDRGYVCSFVIDMTSGKLVTAKRASPNDGHLTFKRKFPIRHSQLTCLRSSFCPLMSFRQGACVLSGSEDACVYLFDVERTDNMRACLNKLQAHSDAVTDVTFNHDESFLASGDTQGVVIIWKRDRGIEDSSDVSQT